MKGRILLTGASGFVGAALLSQLRKEDYTVLPVYRRKVEGGFEIGDLSSNTDWGDALVDIDTVIHTAARVHVMEETSADPLAEFRRVNVEGTIKLAQQAASAGVRRFIYLSSIKVNGESTDNRAPFSADEQCDPTDPYGLSKKEAEDGLLELAGTTGMEVVVIRPPLVYGPGVKANFQSMMSWLIKGVPLPLGAINNRRSLVSIGNLIDLICVCICHPNAANQVFLVSDDMDISVTDLLRGLSHALGCNTPLIPVPQLALTSALKLIGKGAVAERLCGSLQLDIAKTKEQLDWTPPVALGEGLANTAQAYCQARAPEPAQKST
ncbi:UDP-glucose 4-epimerase family protein [Microbulbifer sp. TRSA001]|uniref:UDP-glucose 4-epimerase family protein n=1 Tax=unclassified Microbulbifer TaxID=2619833 RepID=UPI0024AE0A3F|nr:SDR family oxidoreductase [Microbulbifer sp. VAAF005]WHI46767.1 SDR family oxidoreductase [Microbulbifer sp. VAAF005]